MQEFNTNFIEETLFLAKKAALEDEVPVGAVVVLNEKIIGRGYNMREQTNNPVAHAEILALQDAAQSINSWRLNQCILVVTLEPCLMCLAACQQARIHSLCFGAYDPKGGALSLGYRLHEDSRTNHRFIVTYSPHFECSKILKEFFEKKRRFNLKKAP